jgi:hypothetical protein
VPPALLAHERAMAKDPNEVYTMGFVPLRGMVGYGATVWNPPPTHPPRITEHGAPGGSDPPPPELRNMKPGISGITAGIR